MTRSAPSATSRSSTRCSRGFATSATPSGSTDRRCAHRRAPDTAPPKPGPTGDELVGSRRSCSHSAIAIRTPLTDPDPHADQRSRGGPFEVSIPGPLLVSAAVLGTLRPHRPLRRQGPARHAGRRGPLHGGGRVRFAEALRARSVERQNCESPGFESGAYGWTRCPAVVARGRNARRTTRRISTSPWSLGVLRLPDAGGRNTGVRQSLRGQGRQPPEVPHAVSCVL